MEKIEENEIWKEISKLSLAGREHIIDANRSKIEERLNCKIIDRPYGDLGTIKNPAMAVKDHFRNVCYLKEFVPITG